MVDSNGVIRKEVWGAWATVGFGALCGLIVSVVQLFAIGVLAVVRYKVESRADVATFVEGISEDGTVLAVITCVDAIPCVLLLVLVVKLRKGLPFTRYLAFVPMDKKTIGRVVALAVGLVALSDGAVLLLGKSVVTQFQINAYQTAAWPILLFVAVVVVAPFIEEMYFRGFLLEGLRRSRLGTAGAIILTSLAWSALHVQYDVFIVVVIFIQGIVLGVVRVKTGSIWSVIMMHTCFNFVATIETVLYARAAVG